LAQLGQGLAPDQRRDQETVILQRTLYLHQRARQVVHCLQSKQRNGEIEAGVPGWKALEVADDWQKIANAQARLSWGKPNDAIDLSSGGQRDRAMRAGRAKIGGESEPPFDQRQPVAEVFGRPREQEVSLSPPANPTPDAVEAPVDQISIEYLRRRWMRHGRCLCARRPLAQNVYPR
jgi:hypothetical protein